MSPLAGGTLLRVPILAFYDIRYSIALQKTPMIIVMQTVLIFEQEMALATLVAMQQSVCLTAMIVARQKLKRKKDVHQNVLLQWRVMVYVKLNVMQKNVNLMVVIVLHLQQKQQKSSQKVQMIKAGLLIQKQKYIEQEQDWKHINEDIFLIHSVLHTMFISQQLGLFLMMFY